MNEYQKSLAEKIIIKSIKESLSCIIMMDLGRKRTQSSKMQEYGREINGTSKYFKHYFMEVLTILDNFYKVYAKSTKNLSSQIICEEKDLAAIWIGNFSKYQTELVILWQGRLNEIESGVLSLDTIKRGKDEIIESTKSAEKKLDKCLETYLKNLHKYEKQSTEFNQRYEEYQKVQKTGYNISLAQQKETKMRVFVKEIEFQEVILNKEIVGLNLAERQYSENLISKLSVMKGLFNHSVDGCIELIKLFATTYTSITELLCYSIENNYMPALKSLGVDVQIMQSSNLVVGLERIREKYEQSTQNLTDDTIRLIYFDLAKQSLEKLRKIIEDRLKNTKAFKSYITDLIEFRESIQKNLLKYMANRSSSKESQIGNMHAILLNSFQAVLETFVDENKQHAHDLTSKLQLVNGILNEQGSMEKSLSALIQRISKSYSVSENGVFLHREYSVNVSNVIAHIVSQESQNVRTFINVMQGLFSATQKQMQIKSALFIKAIDNATSTQEQLKLEIQTMHKGMNEEVMRDGQSSTNLGVTGLNNQKEEQDFVKFKKLFFLPEEFEQEFIQEQLQKKNLELNSISEPLREASKMEDSVKISASLAKKFNVPENDFLVDSYNCSYSSGNGLHGKLYIFNTMIGFSSSLISRTFLGTTKFIFNFIYSILNLFMTQKEEEVQYLSFPTTKQFRFQRSKHAYIIYFFQHHILLRLKSAIFNNSIEIITQKGILVFSSFMNKNRCYRLIKQQMEQFDSLKNKKKKTIKKSKNEKCGSSESDNSDDDEDELEEEKDEDDGQFEDEMDGSKGDLIIESETIALPQHLDKSEDENKQSILQQIIFPPILPEEFKLKMQERRARIMSQKTYLNLEAENSEVTFENTHTREVFIEIFSDKKYLEHTSFSQYFQVTQLQDKEVEITEWNPSPPSLYQDWRSEQYEEFLNFPDFSERRSSFIHPIREKVLMGPKTCQVNSEDKIFWLTHDEVLIQREFRISKVPMSDCFTQINFYHIQATGPSTVKLTFGFLINFIKSSMFKSMILKSSTSESRDTWNNKFKPSLITHLKEVIQSRERTENNKLKTETTKLKNEPTQQKTQTTKLKNITNIVSKRKRSSSLISNLDIMITQNKLQIDNYQQLNNESSLIHSKVDDYIQKYQKLISQQNIFFYLIIAIIIAQLLILFK